MADEPTARDRLGHRAQAGLHGRRRAGASSSRRASPRSRAGPTRTCTAAGRGRSASTRASPRPRRRTRASATCSTRGQTGLSIAFDLPTQLGLDSDDPRAARRGRAHRRRDRLARRHGDRSSTGIPLERGLDVDDDQRARRRCSCSSTSSSPRSRASPAPSAARHGPERHPQGVHRARELHLPAAALDAAHDRPLRLLRRAAAALEHDLDLRLPHPRGGLDRGAGARVHARERDRLLRGGGRLRGSRRTSSASGSRSSSTRTTTSSRRWRSSARRGGCGRGSCASASARRTRRRWRCASTRRPAARR